MESTAPSSIDKEFLMEKSLPINTKNSKEIKSIIGGYSGLRFGKFNYYFLN